MSGSYPELIQALPDVAGLPDGVRGKLLQGPDAQLVFFDIDPVGQIPPHAHGDQWGVVIEGEMDLTIDGRTRTYKPGDSYFIPAGTLHSATFRTRVRVLDLFADRDRYRTRAG